MWIYQLVNTVAFPKYDSNLSRLIEEYAFDEAFFYLFSYDTVAKNKKKIDWLWVSMQRGLSEMFMKTFMSDLHWHQICVHQNLSELFMEKYAHIMMWRNISEFQELSEKFMDKFASYLHWDKLFGSQNMSDKFIIKHRHKANILRYPHIYRIRSAKRGKKLVNCSVDCSVDYSVKFE